MAAFLVELGARVVVVVDVVGGEFFDFVVRALVAEAVDVVEDVECVVDLLATTCAVVPGISVATARPIEPAPRIATTATDAVNTRTRLATAARPVAFDCSPLCIATSRCKFVVDNSRHWVCPFR